MVACDYFILLLTSRLFNIIQLCNFFPRAVPTFDADLSTVYYELLQIAEGRYVAKIVQYNATKNISQVFDPKIAYTQPNTLTVSNNYIFCLVRHLVI